MAPPCIGIELEFDSASSEPEAQYNRLAADMGADSYLEIDWEHITYDWPDQHGYEASLLLPVSEWEPWLAYALDGIAAKGAKVDKRCGLHVHLDCRAVNRVNICDRLYDAQDKLYALCADWRKTNPESRPVPARGRYGWKSQGFWIATKYPTVEVRMMEATFDVQKIVGWVRTLHEIAGLPLIQKMAA